MSNYPVDLAGDLNNGGDDCNGSPQFLQPPKEDGLIDISITRSRHVQKMMVNTPPLYLKVGSSLSGPANHSGKSPGAGDCERCNFTSVKYQARDESLQMATTTKDIRALELALLNDPTCCLSAEDIGSGPAEYPRPRNPQCLDVRSLRQGDISDQDLRRCPACDCGEGEIHGLDCPIEHCSGCDRWECNGCKGHNRRKSAWTSRGPALPVPVFPSIRRVESKRRSPRLMPAESLFRYPGGKQGMVETIMSRLAPMLNDLDPDGEYREPFLGGGSVAIAVLKGQPGRRTWLNDADPTVAALWDGVINDADDLKMMVGMFSHVLSADKFYLFQRELRSIRTPTDLDRYGPSWVALAKLALHAMSFSGLGIRAGGPMGGRRQWIPYSIRSRYNPARICSTIDDFRAVLGATRLHRGTCTCLPFERLFEPGNALFYLDPPYYGAGLGLYQLSFSHGDHERLSDLLKREQRGWLLSYDDHPVIRDLYQGWCRVEEIPVNCSINGPRKKTELLISSR